jgi:hypothetical protein
VTPLLDALAGKTVLLRASAGPLDRVLVAAFVGAGAQVVPNAGPDAPPYAALVPLWFEGPIEVAADEAFAVIEVTQRYQRHGLRYLVALAPEPSTPATRVGYALAKTLMAYAAAHLSDSDVRLNLITLGSAPTALVLERAAQAALALSSGWLDAVRGQQLTIVGE